jgi:cytochrome c peroxidase
LGKYVFFDKISNPPRMACVTCHDPETGGTGSVSGVNLHQVAITGANPHTVGNLKPPTNAYASLIPPLFKGCRFGVPGICGGNFWNGRAEGEFPPDFTGATKHIGEEVFYTTDGEYFGDIELDYALDYDSYFGPTADQALNPMPNDVEQNIERKAVCNHVKKAKYAPLYKLVWGVDIDCSDQDPVAVQAEDVDLPEYPFDIAFKRIMLSVCAWQASVDLNSFSSKRDKALQRELNGTDVDESPGKFPLVGLTDEENRGHDLFYGVTSVLNPTGKNARCSACHSDNPGIPGVPADTGAEQFQLYADDGYHNIGTPKNPEIPVTYNLDGTIKDPDLGLKGLTGDERHRGFHKTPTLRCVDKRKGEGFVKAYTHNGWFKSLESIVHFYNTAWFGGQTFIPGQGLVNVPYEDTTASTFGVVQCPEGIETEKDALANNCWPKPAVSGNGPGSPAIPFLLGDLKLTLDEEAAIVAYLKTLTDEHTAKAPKPYKSNKK